ncbi:MAG: serine/threonine protein kinase [Cyanobacteria bacterium J06588_5]
MTDQYHPRGKLLNDRQFRIERRLGSGGFGDTYLAIDQTINVRRAIKELKSSMPSRQLAQQVIQRFHREVETLRGFEHRLIPRVYGSFSESSRHYMVQEWIDGETLEDKVGREGKQSEIVVTSILRDLLDVVIYIHRRDIIHRDIKPDNIIIRKSSGEPVLIDFGIVKEISRTETGQTQASFTQSIGSPGYQSREQFNGWPERCSDVYSLGRTAVFLLTGYPPGALEEKEGRLNWHYLTFSDVSDRFKQFIDTAIQEHKEDRFPSAEHMLDALESFDSPSASLWTAAGKMTDGRTRQMLPTPDAAAAKPSQPPEPGADNEKGLSFYVSLLLGGGLGLLVLIVFGVLPGFEQLPIPQAWKDGIRTALTREVPTDSATGNDTPQPAPTAPPPTSAPTQTPEPTSTPTPELSSEPTQTPIPPDTVGTVTGNPGFKRIRSGPGTEYGEVGRVWVGEALEVVSREEDSEGYEWYKVVTVDQQEGWIAGQLVELQGVGQ